MNLQFLAAIIIVSVVGCSTVLTALGRFPPDWTKDIYLMVLGAVLGALTVKGKEYLARRRPRETVGDITKPAGDCERNCSHDFSYGIR